MKKLFTLLSLALLTLSANGQTESYTASTADGMSTDFSAVVDSNGVATNASDGKSIVNISATDNVTLVAVGGTTPASNSETGTGDCIDAEGNVSAWNDIKWTNNYQSDIDFPTLRGTGNPYVGIYSEAIVTDGVESGYYRAAYKYYESDGSAGMPLTGLYYTLTPKVAGTFKVGIWANKGKRKTYIVDESTYKPVTIGFEGYINGQNESYTDQEGNSASRKKYLSQEEIDSIHNWFINNDKQSAYLKLTAADSTNADVLASKVDSIDNVVDSTYEGVIGGGNQPAWVYINFTAEAGKTYWLFQHSSQVGFRGFEFTPGDSQGILEVSARAKEGASYNIIGQRVSSLAKGIIIRNGKKYINR